MNQHPDVTTRRLLNWIIVSAMVWLLVRVAFVQSREGTLPFQSANDRSRWCTVRALVDEGTYQIDQVIRTRGWDTIDKVAHAGRDGQMHFYSSKPTLLPTLVAVPYWLLKSATGWTLTEEPMRVGRLLVALVNGAGLLALLIPLRNILLTYGPNRQTALVVMLFASWGTYLTSFAITLNNHFIAAAAVMVSAACYLRIERDQRLGTATQSGWGRGATFLLMGAAAAFAVANELPALAFFALLSLRCLGRHPQQTLQSFLPGAALVFLVAAGTNYLAHDTFSLPYMHRAEGKDWQSGNWYVYPGSYWSSDKKSLIDQGEPSRATYAFHVLMGHHGIATLTPFWLLLFLGWPPPSERERRSLAIMAVAVTVLCLVFYIGLRPAEDRNYGGRSVAFRWMLWLAPLWWIQLIDPVGRCLHHRMGRVVAWLLLFASVLSAAYGWLLPWKHPWLYELLIGVP